MNFNAKQWVDALRSGEYKQAQGRLRGEDGYCCLGVACDLYAKDTGLGEWTNQFGIWVFADPHTQEDSSLPQDVREWLGLFDLSGGYGLPGEHGATLMRSLADDNDNGATFDEIAATIDAEPGGLFE